MFTKLLTALVLMVVIGSAVFSLRQQRLELMHEITGLHRQMNRDRQRTWDMQVRIADRTRPGALRDAIARAGLDMEPAVAQRAQATDDPSGSLADASHEPR
jgi:cell division protein FtsL